MATISTIANSDLMHSNSDNLSTPPYSTPSVMSLSSLCPILCPHKAIEARETSTDTRDEIILLILLSLPLLKFVIVFVKVPSFVREFIVTRSLSRVFSFSSHFSLLVKEFTILYIIANRHGESVNARFGMSAFAIIPGFCSSKDAALLLNSSSISNPLPLICKSRLIFRGARTK